LFEHEAPVLQVLTSDTTATAVGLLYWLRARWRIENMFKYATARGGIDALADYGMDVGPDTRKVTNPDRTSARKTLAAAQDELATAERALPQLLNSQGTPQAEERRAARSTPQDRRGHRRSRRRQDRATAHPSESPGHRPGPGRDTCPPPH
jgi:hypothetical protein